jgi:DNA modification methylase
MSTITLKHGDVIEQLKHIADNSVDAIITDPPYNLSFMGKKWDNKGAPKQFQEWCSAWSAECLRVLRQGGYLLSFGGTRTFHRIASGIEDAGFVIKDCLSWNYGSGFPKSHNISKAIDKKSGNVRKRVPIVDISNGKEKTKDIGKGWKMTSKEYTTYSDEAITLDAEKWNGYGTALKPAWEPIILAQKPFKGTIVNNVLTHGVGGMNIDATRIESDGSHKRPFQPTNQQREIYGKQTGFQPTNANGRFPANAIFDEEAGAILNEQSGDCKTGSIKPYMSDGSKSAFIADKSFRNFSQPASSGGAARFFYCPKTPKKEKTCMGFVDNKHPTVKPIKLMEWLIKLTCPTAEAMGRQPVIIDCFVGSGSTALAANRLNVDCIGIDADEESLTTARLRLMNDWRLQKGSNPRLKGYVPNPIMTVDDDLGFDITGNEVKDEVRV